MANLESLHALEGLMTEFFANNTTNARKKEIEELLNNFSQQRDAWHHCLFFMANTSNEYVMMYCMTVLENLINRQWVGLSVEDKTHIRHTLQSFLLAQHEKVPSFVRNKLVKLVVDIGRSDWPHLYPDFLPSILQAVQEPSTMILGLILLQTTSEELACPREDLSVARKQELHKLLLAQVPNMLSILNNILSGILEKHRSFVSATPPPSPTRVNETEDSVNKTPTRKVTTSSPTKPSILSNMFKSPQNRLQTESLPPLDAHAQRVSVLALHCLGHLFSWIPLSSTITPQLLNTVFNFAAFGCEAAPGATGSNPGTSTQSGVHELGILAMTCINELLAKNCVPLEFEEFLLQMFQQTFYLLQRITKESTTNSTGNRLAQLHESYVDKFTEFLRLFVSIHLRRFESNNMFPILDFLSLLFKYTFKQPHNEGYFNCLDIWTVFLDYLSTSMSSRTGALGDNLLSKYNDALVSLVSSVLQRMQFKFNQSQLDELDDETLDDDCQTEWQHFLRQNLETIAKVSDLLPARTFTTLIVPFQENLEIYLNLEQHLSKSADGSVRLTVSAENDSRRLHCTLRDLSSLLQAVGRLADHFIAEKFQQSFSDAHTLMQKLISTAAYGTRVKLYNVSGLAPVLHADFVEVHAQSMAALKACVSWLAQYHVESGASGVAIGDQSSANCRAMLTSILDTVLPLIHKQVPDKVIQSSTHLLLSLLTTVRASFFWQLPQLQAFYNCVAQATLNALNQETFLQFKKNLSYSLLDIMKDPDMGCASFLDSVQLLVYRSLSHYLLLPWTNVPETDQDWENRKVHHEAFLAKLTSDFLQLKQTGNLAENKQLQEQAKPCVSKTLALLTDLVDSIAVEGVSVSKRICYNSVQAHVQTALHIFPVYIHQADIADCILKFFLSLFNGLRVQMGVAFAEQIIRTFMSLFNHEQMKETISQETSSGCKVVEKFLQILEVVVIEPGQAFKALLPGIFNICMNEVYPAIAQRASPDIKPSLYQLLHQLLNHNWRYFFKSPVLTSFNSQDHDEQMEHQDEFISIMQAFGQSFMQPDIEVFRHNLEALENLNENRKLYTKRIVKEMMLGQFLHVLVQVLIVKSHDLLSEEIGIVVYNMASVDFDGFYKNYLPQLLRNCDGIDDNQRAVLAQNFKVDTDLPSFTQCLHRFVNDLRYYRLMNSSLPAGSVTL